MKGVGAGGGGQGAGGVQTEEQMWDVKIPDSYCEGDKENHWDRVRQIMGSNRIKRGRLSCDWKLGRPSFTSKLHVLPSASPQGTAAMTSLVFCKSCADNSGKGTDFRLSEWIPWMNVLTCWCAFLLTLLFVFHGAQKAVRPQSLQYALL